MCKRILFIILYIVCFPVLFLAIPLTLLFSVIAVILYIINGDEDEKLIDFAVIPLEFCILLPYFITGEFKPSNLSYFDK